MAFAREDVLRARERVVVLVRLRPPLDRARARDGAALLAGVAGLRSEAGISSWTTAFVNDGMSFSRYVPIRSSSRRMRRASFTVSSSASASASASIAVYSAISSASLAYSV